MSEEQIQKLNKKIDELKERVDQMEKGIGDSFIAYGIKIAKLQKLVEGGGSQKKG